MPKMPKWLGDTMEKVFSKYMHDVEVTAVKYLDKQLKMIRFEGDLRKTKFTNGNVVEFRVTATDYRHYTPSYYNAEEGVCEVVFYLHGQGPGSKWATTLEAGSKLKLLGPGGKISYNDVILDHFFFGDETSIGVCDCLKNMALEKGGHYFCLLELEQQHFHWPEFTGLESHKVQKSFEFPASKAIQYLEDLEKQSEKNWLQEYQNGIFYLTGRAKSIQSMRKFLLSKGITSKQIQTEPYWAEGKKGL